MILLWEVYTDWLWIPRMVKCIMKANFYRSFLNIFFNIHGNGDGDVTQITVMFLAMTAAQKCNCAIVDLPALRALLWTMRAGTVFL